MYILYVITKTNAGGAQKYVYDLAVAAKAKGHTVTVAYGLPTKRQKGSDSLITRLTTAHIRSESIRGLTRDVGFIQEIFALFELMRLFKKEQPDIVHINSSKAGALGALAARFAGVPQIIFTAHGWSFNESRPWWQKVILFFASSTIVWLSHKTICVSEAVQRDIARMPFVQRKLAVIHNGITCPLLLSREKARVVLHPPAVGRYWVGMISELHPTKCIDEAIRAFAKIVESHPEAILVIIGEGEERIKLETLVRELHLHNHISFAGSIKNAATVLLAFDLFIHTSRSEALPFVILEAGCASLPVVATRVGGIPEIIPDEDHGLLVPAHDITALVTAINSLIKDSPRAHTLGARLHARVLQEFSEMHMVEDTFAVYRI